jgi:hypothetical protein
MRQPDRRADGALVDLERRINAIDRDSGNAVAAEPIADLAAFFDPCCKHSNSLFGPGQGDLSYELDSLHVLACVPNESPLLLTHTIQKSMIDETQLLKTTNIRTRQGTARTANGLYLVAFRKDEPAYGWLPASRAREPGLADDLKLSVKRKASGKDFQGKVDQRRGHMSAGLEEVLDRSTKRLDLKSLPRSKDACDRSLNALEDRFRHREVLMENDEWHKQPWMSRTSLACICLGLVPLQVE